MPVFRYDTSGQWFKGNTHIHSTASDGGRSFAELAEMYAGAGYDFLFRTDHWVLSDAAADKTACPLLWLDGVELNGIDNSGSDYHVVCLGALKDMNREMGFDAGMEAARAQGALLIMAHPQWMGNSQDDCLRWEFDGVEVYNHVCRWLNGKGGGAAYWNWMLANNPNTLAFAVDDAHVKDAHPGWNGGWIAVNAAGLTRETVMSAIRSGNFYSSCGPEIHSIEYDGAAVHIETSPVQFIRLAGPGSIGSRLGSFDKNKLMTEATLDIPRGLPYVYLEIEDNRGRRAWTNPLFKAGE
jgi:hypothetical protein